MADREWQPGDVAMARYGDFDEWLVVRHRGAPDYWSAPGDWPNGQTADQCTYRPLIVLDPEQSDLYIQSDGRDMTVWHGDEALLTEKEAGPVLWAHLTATLPTRDDPQPEPTDPAVRVRDAEGFEWARVSGGWWASRGGASESWQSLLDHEGPLEVIQPATDAEPEARPFKVGDKVRIAETGPILERGTVGRIVSATTGGSRDDWRVRLKFMGRDTTMSYREENLRHADGERP